MRSLTLTLHHLALGAALAVAITACGTSSRGTVTPKLDSGTNNDASSACVGSGVVCGGGVNCCANLTCTNGICMPGGNNPDFAVGGKVDLSMGGNTGTNNCEMTYDSCYLTNCIDMQGMVDQACMMQCDQMAKSAKNASDAEALFSCVNTAFAGPCMTPCADSTDAGIYNCRQCLWGTCSKQGNATVCKGGNCSTAITTCLADP